MFLCKEAVAVSRVQTNINLIRPDHAYHSYTYVCIAFGASMRGGEERR